MHFTKLRSFIYNAEMRSKNILGVRVDFGMTMDDVIDRIEQAILDGNIRGLICTTNPEFIIEAQKDQEFKRLVNTSVISVPDGIGVLAAEYYLEEAEKVEDGFLRIFKLLYLGMKTGFKTIKGDFKSKRITGVALSERMFKLSADKNYSIFLLGGWPKTILGKNMKLDGDFANKTAEAMRKKYPSVNIVGATSKYNRKKEHDEITLEHIRNRMKEVNIDTIDIMLVAYTQNTQEKWIDRNSSKVPVKISMGVGGTFDYLIGYYKKVPDIFTNMGLDWVFRLFTQPFRFRRIINAFPIFPIKIFLESIKK